MRHLGRAALLLTAAAWVALAASLLLGGIDPSPSSARALQVVGTASIVCTLLGLAGAVTALITGRQRVAAAAALALGLLYALALTGLLFLPFLVLRGY